MKEVGEKERFCGNCDSHNAYHYPDRVFCSTRYAQNKNPIVKTLWYCEDWNLVGQECHCVREAMHRSKDR